MILKAAEIAAVLIVTYAATARILFIRPRELPGFTAALLSGRGYRRRAVQVSRGRQLARDRQRAIRGRRR